MSALAETLATDTDVSLTRQAALSYCAAAAAASLSYEYVITLGQESRFIWPDICAGYARIFLANRVNMIGMFISLILCLHTWPTVASCKKVDITWQFISISTLLLWAGTSTLRVYAISNRNILLAFLTAALAVIPVGVNVLADARYTYIVETYGTAVFCKEDLELSAQTYIELAILSRTALIASDIVVLLVTWWQLCVTARSSGQRWTQSALVVLLLRDSTLYFILFLLLNVAQIVTQLMLGNAFNPLPSFIYPFTTIVISRLLLNFRRLSYRRQMPMHSGSNIAPPTVEEPGFFYRSFLSTIVFRPHSFTQHNNPNQIPSASPIVPASILEDTLESGHAHVAKCGRIDEVSDKDENMIADEG